MRWFGFGFNGFGQIVAQHGQHRNDAENEVKIINITEVTSVNQCSCNNAPREIHQVRTSWSTSLSLQLSDDSTGVFLDGFGRLGSKCCGYVEQSRGCKDVINSESLVVLAFQDRIEMWDSQKEEKRPVWRMDIKPPLDNSDPLLKLPMVLGGYIAFKPPFYRSLSPHLKGVSLALGPEHTILLSASGAVYTWGQGSHGQLGHGTLTCEEEPRAVEALWGVPMKAVAAGGWHCCCISETADLYVWGWNESGQLGLPSRGVTKSQEKNICGKVLPMALQFVYTPDDLLTHVHQGRDNTQPPAAFDTVIQEGWSERMDKGLFRYHLGDLKTRLLPGHYGYVAQLNIQRGTERRKPQEILSIQQEFNARQFNFNKINPEEIICEMVKSEEAKIVLNDHQNSPSKMLVLVNVSPLEFAHCLFVPDPLRCYPQVLTRFAVEVGIETIFLSSNPGFRMGFNSLGGYASVNHLHLHGYYLDHELALESIAVKPLVPEKDFYRLLDFHPGFMFYTETKSVAKVSESICKVTNFLVERNIAHNLFLTRGCPPSDSKPNGIDSSLRKGVRIIVWPRKSCFGAKEESAFNVALCELAGHLPFKNKTDFEKATEENVLEIINKCVLSTNDFLSLEQELMEHLIKS